MVQFYTEILRSVKFRDNNFKPLASNDPATSTSSWDKTGTAALSTDGDILTFSGTGGGGGANQVFTPKSPVTMSINTTTYPYLVTRLKGTGTIGVVITYTDHSSSLIPLVL